MKRHLYVRIYLTLLASLLVMVMLSAVLWRFTTERSDEVEYTRFIGTLVTQALPPDARPAARDASLASLVIPPVEGLALFDRQNKRLASAGTLTGADDRVVLGQERHAHPLSAWRSIPLSDGRLLVARLHSDSVRFHLNALAMIALIALTVALATYPIVRRLTKRLEALAASVDSFGSGELSIRAAESGNDEVSDLASSFNRMADRVTGLLGAHGRMLANASHELRSPLARVRLGLDLYESAPHPELLEGMRRDCSEIDAQIEEILLSSKLDAVDSTQSWTHVDLAALTAEESARLSVPFEVVPAEVRGDMRLLRKLIRNLVENALRHGGEDVETSLRVGDNGDRILHVSDRGPGIAESERERIFEPFYRPANTRETGTGWGLGLALVKQIADHHGGQVRCLSRAGGGCVFEVVLPARPPLRAP
jgi:signal transduction histidine kinase